MYERRERTGYNGANPALTLLSTELRYLMRVSNSVKIVKSRMRGVARRESCDRKLQISGRMQARGQHTSHSLKILIVERPPQKISE